MAILLVEMTSIQIFFQFLPWETCPSQDIKNLSLEDLTCNRVSFTRTLTGMLPFWSGLGRDGGDSSGDCPGRAALQCYSSLRSDQSETGGSTGAMLPTTCLDHGLPGLGNRLGAWPCYSLCFRDGEGGAGASFEAPLRREAPPAQHLKALYLQPHQGSQSWKWERRWLPQWSFSSGTEVKQPVSHTFPRPFITLGKVQWEGEKEQM